MKSIATILFSFCILQAGQRCGDPGSNVTSFTSEKHAFTVKYPAAWHRLNQTIDVLDIINFSPSKMVKGVVLPQGGAAVTVVPAAEKIDTLSQWLLREPWSSQQHIKKEIGPSQEPNGCMKLLKVEWDSEEGPHTFSHITSYYCTTSRRLYRIELSNWRGDPRQGEFQEIAVKIALSLRTLPPARTN